ncbi:MAG: hypothetical protein ACI93P_001265 [bacterium]|jgi:hypothetical protein
MMGVKSKIFNSLLNEAQFTGEILASGVTNIGKVNYAKRGKYFESFISLTTGLERMGKLCVLLDFYIHNNGKFPQDRRMRKIGHSLVELQALSQDLIDRNDIRFEFFSKIDNPIQIKMLEILSQFAKGDRYANINFLTADGEDSNPIKDWYEQVEIPLYSSRISKKKQFQILQNAEIAQLTLGGISRVVHLSESGEDIMDINIASFKTGMSEATAKYRRLYIAQIIRFWLEILRELQYKAMSFKNQDIPWLNECFTIFYNSNSFLLSRKRFDRLR